MERGYVQVYTGDGKGKTTAALGLALRGVGAGLSVFIGQFIKSGDYSEIAAVSELAAAIRETGRRIETRQFGLGHFIKGTPGEADIRAARSGLDECARAMGSGAFDIVILDEINVAIGLGLVPEAAVLEILKKRSGGTEVVLTGRGAPASIIAAADLVTEMREVKHYYSKGVAARTGIEE